MEIFSLRSTGIRRVSCSGAPPVFTPSVSTTQPIVADLAAGVRTQGPATTLSAAYSALVAQIRRGIRRRIKALYEVAWSYTSRIQSRERSTQLRNRKATTLLRKDSDGYCIEDKKDVDF